MKENKSSISKTDSYAAIGEYWDTHDLGDFQEHALPAEFDVDIQSETQLYALDFALSQRVAEIATQRGVSPETLLNLWVQEKLQEQGAAFAS
ncbi:MAG: CopG family antitoxin [bacterium]